MPENFHDVLMQYTMQGYRVIALAWRQLRKMNYVKIQRIQRDEVETKLSFLGLLIMENRLKPETTPVIRELKMAAIRPVMVTGKGAVTTYCKRFKMKRHIGIFRVKSHLKAYFLYIGYICR